MKGDYYRYIAEFASNDKKTVATRKAQAAYEEAHDHAQKKLATTHPVRLGHALNFSVFFYEIQNDPERASRLARDAFDQAIADLDSV